MVTNVILARIMNPSGFGFYSLIITYMTLLNVIASLGLRQSVIRSIARNQKSAFHLLILSSKLKIYGIVLIIILLYIYNLFYHNSISTNYFFIIVIGVILTTYGDSIQNLSLGLQKTELSSFVDIIISSLILLTYLIIPKSIISINSIINIYLIFSCLKVILYLCNIFIRKIHRANSVKMDTSAFDLLKDSMPFYLLSLFTLLSSQIPVLFLNYFSNLNEIAYFNTANKLLIPLTILLNTSLNALFPNLSQLFIKDKEKFDAVVLKSLKFISLFGILLCILISLFRVEIVNTLFGPKYSSTGNVMALQCWYFVMLAFFSCLGTVFGATNNSRILVLTSIAYALISLPILYFCSKFGAFGLSMGYVITCILNILYNSYYLCKILSFRIKTLQILKLFYLIVLCMLFTLITTEYLNFELRICFMFFLFILIYLFRKRLIIYLLIAK